jgi:Bacterial archaeo-eukaryotic release factor family 3
VKELERSLRQKYTDGETRRLLDPFESLAKDKEFWNHTLNGLAVFGAPDFFHVFGLQRTVAEFAVAADSFHTKPLWRFLQSAGRYQVLALSLGRIRFFEGNRYALDEIDLNQEVPRTMVEALGAELTEPHQTVASYAGIGGESTPMRHGHGGKKEEVGIDAERFFRVLDRAVLEHHSQPSELPLVLAALPQHHGLFRRVSRNPFLTAEGITTNPESATAEELRVRAWQVIEPQYHARLAALGEEFKQAASKGLGSDDLAQVAEAAAAGRVATLLIEADRQIPGRIDSATGRIQPNQLNHPQVDDLLDDLGDLVAESGGLVLVIPAERMQTVTGLAATFRY